MHEPNCYALLSARRERSESWRSGGVGVEGVGVQTHKRLYVTAREREHILVTRKRKNEWDEGTKNQKQCRRIAPEAAAEVCGTGGLGGFSLPPRRPGTLLPRLLSQSVHKQPNLYRKN